MTSNKVINDTTRGWIKQWHQIKWWMDVAIKQGHQIKWLMTQ